MKKVFSAALLALLPLTSAMAEGDSQAEQPKKEKKVCRSEKVTGSLTKVKRICMTQAEWDELAANTKKGVDDLNRSAGGPNICADAFRGC